MKKIALSGKLGKGKYALVDDNDFEWLNQWKWQYRSGYATRSQRVGLRKYNKKKKISMHREINGTPNGYDTDHINRNKLDNRRYNLRIATKQENAYNRGINCNNTSGYKGVGWNQDTKKWRPSIKVNGRRIYMGLFLNKLDAARAYNQLALKYFGEFAWLNKL